MKKIIILGCTGSIGKSTICCVKDNPTKFKIVGLSAHSNTLKLLDLASQYNVKTLCLTDETVNKHEDVLFYGKKGLQELIATTDADIIVNGIAGSAGLLPSIETVKQGKTLALANKETIVMAGPLITDLALKTGSKIIPVDSEHSAIFNLIERFGNDCIDSVILTASGGAFKNTPKNELSSMKLSDALKHPTWTMGQKITIDSATLANKGLEVIEAARLFDLPPEKIQVVIHPQSLVHSLIRTKDGVMYAQISKPDMVHPIISALNWPECLPCSLDQLDLTQGVDMTFSPPRLDDFPMLPLAYKALELDGSYTIAYNAANEIAVDAFVKEYISFTDIPSICNIVLNSDWSSKAENFEHVFELDLLARSIAEEAVKKVIT